MDPSRRRCARGLTPSGCPLNQAPESRSALRVPVVPLWLAPPPQTASAASAAKPAPRAICATNAVSDSAYGSTGSTTRAPRLRGSCRRSARRSPQLNMRDGSWAYALCACGARFFRRTLASPRPAQGEDGGGSSDVPPLVPRGSRQRWRGQGAGARRRVALEPGRTSWTRPARRRRCRQERDRRRRAACVSRNTPTITKPRWISTAEALSYLGRDFSDQQRTRVLEELTRKAPLVLDDFDKARPNVSAVQELFNAIEHAMSHECPIIITTNLRPSEVATRWPAPYGEAIASRLAHKQYFEVHHVPGRDRRLDAAG